jgi:hypothetical protein
VLRGGLATHDIAYLLIALSHKALSAVRTEPYCRLPAFVVIRQRERKSSRSLRLPIRCEVVDFDAIARSG